MELQVKKEGAWLGMRVVDMTRIDSMIVFNPNRDIVEDRKQKSGYSLKEISTVLTRLKLIIFFSEFLRDCDRPVIYFDFPRYSVVWYLFLVCFTYLFNPLYLLTYLTIFLILLIGSHSSLWQRYISPHLH